nr:MAG TPA: replisome organizer [Caudoviricetes sp.]
MAERRMFSKTIIDSDAFLDMPLSTQALYFHLSMRADDDGFINNPKKIQRMVGCNQDDITLLIAKRFVIPFESGVCVIKHWRIHNYIRTDRYKETPYQEEKGQLILKDNNSYTLSNEMTTIGIPSGIPDGVQNGYQCETQVRLGKDRLGKDNNTISKDIVSSTKVQPIIDSWNSLGLQKLVAINPNTNRYRLLNARIKEYGLDKVLEAIENIRYSSFLKGQNNKNWTITFDWLIKPNNFTKVLEGNYRDKGDSNNGGIEQNIKSSEDKPQYNFGCFE